MLGADPTNKSNAGERNEIDTVFAIGSGDARYFDPILKNLEFIGLSLKDIYVQNLIQVYLEEETGKNPNWKNDAAMHFSKTKEEFDVIDPKGKIPVLVTAERIFEFLYNHSTPSAKVIYSGEFAVPTEIGDSKLNRPLIPFYRHAKYSLTKKEWEMYKNNLTKLFL